MRGLAIAILDSIWQDRLDKLLKLHNKGPTSFWHNRHEADALFLEAREALLHLAELGELRVEW